MVGSEQLIKLGVCLLQGEEQMIVLIGISLHVCDSSLECLLFDVKLFWAVLDSDFDVRV